MEGLLINMYNNPSLRAIAEQLNKNLEKCCKLAVGKIVKHPDGRTVKITDGTFLSHGRVSIFRCGYWRVIRVICSDMNE